jgi:MFS family permease
VKAFIEPLPAPRDAPPGVLAAAAAVVTVGVLPVFLTGALAVQMREELRFGETELGLTVAVFFGSAAASSAIGGRLAERLGPVAGMRVAAALASVALASVAWLANDLGDLLLCLVVGGVSNAVGQPSTNLYLARRVGAGRLGLAFGVKQSAIPLATLLGGLAVPAVALTVGWRWAFAGGAVSAVVVGASVRGGGGAAAVRRGARRGAGDAGLRPLLLLATGSGLGGAAAGALGAFLVSAAVDAGISEGRAGLLAAACSAVGLATRLVAGARADIRGGRHLTVVALMLAGGGATYLLLATEWPPAIVVGALAGYAVGWGWPGLFNLAVVRNSPGAPGAATGITQSGTYVGGVAGPLLFGFLAGHFSYGWAWSSAAVISLAGAAAVWHGRRLLVRERASRQLASG